MPFLNPTTTDKPSATASAPGIPAALQRYPPESRTERIAYIAAVILVFAAVITAIVLVAMVQKPLVVPDNFRRGHLRDALQGVAQDTAFVQSAELQFGIYNDNIYPVDFPDVEISITSTEKPASGVAYVKATQVASDPWLKTGSEWTAVPGAVRSMARFDGSKGRHDKATERG
ncbi:hypothetical protein AMAG_13072 [Allomyces macrogynus ATCC 38327]|uniref:Uncharacterized protein n=1 Tax=Allomyces macrogynus (strain ATCC 38327) TaxID=578462 RepID=A0A0L0T0Z0_ALLM3|nr:hypothetical protein AMAG_13072 [Allomyces macrogynus ATCC 38327]|eukprot:KNE68417.1 hypothetical protein AMAG_13072 [Allomyces macrogynus ATCC 38327]